MGQSFSWSSEKTVKSSTEIIKKYILKKKATKFPEAVKFCYGFTDMLSGVTLTGVYLSRYFCLNNQNLGAMDVPQGTRLLKIPPGNL